MGNFFLRLRLTKLISTSPIFGFLLHLYQQFFRHRGNFNKIFTLIMWIYANLLNFKSCFFGSNSNLWGQYQNVSSLLLELIFQKRPKIEEKSSLTKGFSSCGTDSEEWLQNGFVWYLQKTLFRVWKAEGNHLLFFVFLQLNAEERHSIGLFRQVGGRWLICLFGYRDWSWDQGWGGGHFLSRLLSPKINLHPPLFPKNQTASSNAHLLF